MDKTKIFFGIGIVVLIILAIYLFTNKKTTTVTTTTATRDATGQVIADSRQGVSGGNYGIGMPNGMGGLVTSTLNVGDLGEISTSPFGPTLVSQAPGWDPKYASIGGVSPATLVARMKAQGMPINIINMTIAPLLQSLDAQKISYTL